MSSTASVVLWHIVCHANEHMRSIVCLCMSALICSHNAPSNWRRCVPPPASHHIWAERAACSPPSLIQETEREIEKERVESFLQASTLRLLGCCAYTDVARIVDGRTVACALTAHAVIHMHSIYTHSQPAHALSESVRWKREKATQREREHAITQEFSRPEQ